MRNPEDKVVLININPAYQRVWGRLPKAEYEALKQSIQMDGLLEKLKVNPDNVLLDGHNRNQALSDLGLPVTEDLVEIIEPENELLYIIRSQINRRHATKYHRIENAIPLVEIERALAKERQGTRTDLTFPKILGNVGDTNEIIGEYVGTSHELVRQALYIVEYGSEEDKIALRIGTKRIHNIWSKLTKKPSEFEYDIYNVWKVATLDPDQDHYPGQTPKHIIKNLIYYYSNAGDKVLDPMAGSGITGTVCEEMGRTAILYDIQPTNENIQTNDILQGLPEEARDTNLVILDPPYYNLLAEDYPENAFTESYESFLEAMEQTLRNLFHILDSGGNVAIILKPMNTEMVSGAWLDMTFDCVKIAEKIGYTLIKRICAPLSTQQFKAHNVVQAKERRVMLNTLRDIVVLRGLTK